jgi:hypothetical protein
MMLRGNVDQPPEILYEILFTVHRTGRKYSSSRGWGGVVNTMVGTSDLHEN